MFIIYQRVNGELSSFPWITKGYTKAVGTFHIWVKYGTAARFKAENASEETHSCLVGGLTPSEKYEGQLGLLFPTEPIYGKKMFQTTNPMFK